MHFECTHNVFAGSQRRGGRVCGERGRVQAINLPCSAQHTHTHTHMSRRCFCRTHFYNNLIIFMSFIRGGGRRTSGGCQAALASAIAKRIQAKVMQRSSALLSPLFPPLPLPLSLCLTVSLAPLSPDTGSANAHNGVHYTQQRDSNNNNNKRKWRLATLGESVCVCVCE